MQLPFVGSCAIAIALMSMPASAGNELADLRGTVGTWDFTYVPHPGPTIASGADDPPRLRESSSDRKRNSCMPAWKG